LHDFVSTAYTATSSPDCNIFAADAFSQNEPIEYELDEKTQLKIVDPGPTKPDLDLPGHVNALYVKTLDEVDLPNETTVGLKRFLLDHQETFATSSTYLGFCPLVQHDINTGDARPIKQSLRRPTMAAREAEDEILSEMLETVEPSN